MNTVLDKPSCLHIPPLFEGEGVNISWGSVNNAASYELECVFDESFSSAEKGKAWGGLHEQDYAWSEIGEELTWQEFENQPSQGLTWLNADFADRSLGGNGNIANGWKQFHELPPEYTIYKGPGSITASPDQSGTWGNMNARFLTWSEAHEYLPSWFSAENGASDDEPHFSCQVRIPLQKKSASLRLRAVAEDGIAGEYITSTQLPVTPVFKRTDKLRLSAVKGDEFPLFIHVRDLERFSDIALTLDYSPYYLQVDEYPAYLRYGMPLGGVDKVPIKQFFKENGRIRFQCVDLPYEGMRTNGLFMVLYVKALHNGVTEVKLY